jgi:hypothetical protein
MGTWGVGLYADDMAKDLQASARAVLRLPLEEDRLVEILCDGEAAAARDPDNEDHTIFWLVLADQFEKKGVACAQVRERALAIIDGGADLAMLERRGMAPGGLRKRGALLQELRGRLLAAPAVSRPRATLREPQPFVFDIGGAYAYPVGEDGWPVNPYAGPSFYARKPFRRVGDGLIVIVRRDRSFGYLAWYQALVATSLVAEAAAGQLLAGLQWDLESPGTCPPLHFRKMQLRQVGALPLDEDRLRARFPRGRPGVTFYGWDGRGAAVADISIVNRMHIQPPGVPMRQSMQAGRPQPLASLSEILATPSSG